MGARQAADIVTLFQTRKHGNCESIATLRPPDIVPVILGCFDQFCTVHAHKLLIISFHRNSDIVIRFSDPDFLKGSNDLAIRQRFQAMTLTFDT